MATAKYKYQTNAGNVFYCRTDSDSEVAGIRGAEPAGAQTEYMTFEFSKNSKQVGCRPRSAILRREYVGGAAAADSCIDTSGSRNKYVIVLTSAHYDSLQIGTAVSVNGINYTVAGKRREEMR